MHQDCNTISYIAGGITPLTCAALFEKQTLSPEEAHTLLVMLRMPLPTVLRLLPVKLWLDECCRAALPSVSSVS